MKKLLAGIILFLISHSVFAQNIKNQYKHNCRKGDSLFKITSEIADQEKACKAEGISTSLEIKPKDRPFRLNKKDFEIEYNHSCFPNPQLFPENSGKNSAYSFTVVSKNPNKLEVCLNEFKKRNLIEGTSVVDLKRTCLLDSKTSDCFSVYRENLKKLGCDYEQIECESSYSLGVSGPETKTCGYVSKKCHSSSTRSCPIGFNSRYLDATQKEIICVKSFDTKGGDTIEPKEERSIR